MKIDAPRAYSGTANGKLIKDASYEKLTSDDVPVRIIRESDWRKIMAVVKAVDSYWPDATFCAAPDEIYFPLSALRKHLEKRK